MLHEEAWRHLVGGWHELVVTDDCEGCLLVYCECGDVDGVAEICSRRNVTI